MADVSAPSGWYPDLQIPSLLRWWDGQTWTGHMAPVGAAATPRAASAPMATRVRPSPARVPELVPVSAPEPHHHGGRPGKKQDFDTEVAELFEAMAAQQVVERDQLRTELLDLTGQIPPLRQERDDLRTELSDLTGQIPGARQERDDLRTELSELRAQVPECGRSGTTSAASSPVSPPRSRKCGRSATICWRPPFPSAPRCRCSNGSRRS